MLRLMSDDTGSLQAAFDPAEALSIVDGDRELFQELVDMFRESYPAELSAIGAAIGSRDSDALRRASHHLKGTLGTLAAGPARKAAMQLESLGSHADLDPAPAVYLEMERQLRALDRALSAWK
jgi:HPt (histidine-containing phosphotransfer) domain-containing protein